MECSPFDEGWPFVTEVGEMRFEVSGVDSEWLFAGVARTADVERYIEGAPHRRFDDGLWMPHGRWMVAPGQQSDVYIWDAAVSGTGTLTLDWVPQPGEWSLVVVMDGATRPGVTADLRFGATVPDLNAIGIGVLAAGVLFLLAGTGLTAYATRRRPQS